jgi:hypothetical protein
MEPTAEDRERVESLYQRRPDAGGADSAADHDPQSRRCPSLGPARPEALDLRPALASVRCPTLVVACELGGVAGGRSGLRPGSGRTPPRTCALCRLIPALGHDGAWVRAPDTSAPAHRLTPGSQNIPPDTRAARARSSPAVKLLQHRQASVQRYQPRLGTTRSFTRFSQALEESSTLVSGAGSTSARQSRWARGSARGSPTGKAATISSRPPADRQRGRHQEWRDVDVIFDAVGEH